MFAFYIIVVYHFPDFTPFRISKPLLKLLTVLTQDYRIRGRYCPRTHTEVPASFWTGRCQGQALKRCNWTGTNSGHEADPPALGKAGRKDEGSGPQSPAGRGWYTEPARRTATFPPGLCLHDRHCVWCLGLIFHYIQYSRTFIKFLHYAISLLGKPDATFNKKNPCPLEFYSGWGTDNKLMKAQLMSGSSCCRMHCFRPFTCLFHRYCGPKSFSAFISLRIISWACMAKTTTVFSFG